MPLELKMAPNMQSLERALAIFLLKGVKIWEWNWFDLLKYLAKNIMSCICYAAQQVVIKEQARFKQSTFYDH